MARLAATVYVKDPETHQTARLDAGSEPEPHLAALVPNPDAWEDGKPPAEAANAEAGEQSKAEPEPDKADDSDTKQAAKKTAATRPARGRKAAAEGTGGQ